MSIQTFHPAQLAPRPMNVPSAADRLPRRVERQIEHVEHHAVVSSTRVLAAGYVAGTGLAEVDRLSRSELDIVSSIPVECFEHRLRVAARCAAVVDGVAQVAIQELQRLQGCGRPWHGCR